MQIMSELLQVHRSLFSVCRIGDFAGVACRAAVGARGGKLRASVLNAMNDRYVKRQIGGVNPQSSDEHGTRLVKQLKSLHAAV